MKREIFDTLYKEYYGYVYHIAHNVLLCSDSAHDVCQEVFLRVYKALEKGTEIRFRKAWIIRITSNEIKRYVQKYRVHRGEEYDDNKHSLTLLERYFECDASDKRELLYEYVSFMKESAMKDIVISYYFEGLSTKEVADKLNVPQGSIGKGLYDFRKKIFADLKKKGLLRVLWLFVTTAF